MVRTIARSAVLVVLVHLCACGPSLGHAKASFRNGRYPEAKRELLAIGAHLSSERAERAEYALYLGATYAELGDIEASRRWLEEAYATERRFPGTLSQTDWARLRLALEAVAPFPSFESSRALGPNAE